jgi:Type IV secretion system pilin
MKIKKIILNIFILSVLVLPVVSFASGLVPCGGHGEGPCDFTALMTMINRIDTFVFTDLALPICAVMFAYAGFLLISAGGEAAHAREKAKSIFTNAVIGLVIAVAAWLIVKTLLTIMGFDGAWIFDSFNK